MSDHIIEILLPKLGESIVSATVVQWLKKEGDSVSADEPLLEVSTDKVNSEIPAPSDGILSQILVRENEEVPVGSALAKLLVNQKDGAFVSQEVKVTIQGCPLENSSNFLSPAVLNMARSSGISLDALSRISGTGNGGRVTKRDLENHLQTASKPNQKSEELPKEKVESHIEKMPMGALRKAIADNMVRSFYEAPHASLVAEVDVTDAMKKIQEQKESFKAEHGVKLTITSYIVQAITKAVQLFPMVNASIDKDTILMKRFVNMGIAVSVENGVIVPVIRNCETKDLPLIAKEIVRLSLKAREGNLTNDDLASGTITMTNFGMSGIQMGIPIIKHPEVAIIGVGSIHKKVSAMEDNSIAIRQKVYLTMTFDHRLIDGIYGANFLNKVKSFLETIA
jgi:2-oxoglutarate dehydrogenase E2 component (dihydrolipoamide succinyltransferase)